MGMPNHVLSSAAGQKALSYTIQQTETSPELFNEQETVATQALKLQLLRRFHKINPELITQDQLDQADIQVRRFQITDNGGYRFKLTENKEVCTSTLDGMMPFLKVHPSQLETIAIGNHPPRNKKVDQIAENFPSVFLSLHSDKFKFFEGPITIAPQTYRNPISNIEFTDQFPSINLAILNALALLDIPYQLDDNYGTIISQIAGQNTKNWKIYVNGRELTTSPSAYQLTEGDKVIFASPLFKPEQKAISGALPTSQTEKIMDAPSTTVEEVIKKEIVKVEDNNFFIKIVREDDLIVYINTGETITDFSVNPSILFWGTIIFLLVLILGVTRLSGKSASSEDAEDKNEANDQPAPNKKVKTKTRTFSIPEELVEKTTAFSAEQLNEENPIAALENELNIEGLEEMPRPRGTRTNITLGSKKTKSNENNSIVRKIKRD